MDRGTGVPLAGSALSVRRAALLSLLLALLLIGVALVSAAFGLSDNEYLYVYSSTSQVVASIYGLTITGYIFLRNQQDRLADFDETLTEILERIQSQQFAFIRFLTYLSLSSVIISVIAISAHDWPPPVRALLCGGAAASFFAAMLWTGHFVLDAMRPGQIARASRAIKAEVEVEAGAPQGSTRPGKLDEFLQTCNDIEARLDGYAEQVLGVSRKPATDATATVTLSPGPRGNWTRPQIVRALLEERIIDPELGTELARLMRYRNALVHGEDLTISVDAVNRARGVLERLAQALQLQQHPVGARQFGTAQPTPAGARLP